MAGKGTTAVEWLPKRYYVFSLRDEIPLPADGWTVHLHNPACYPPGGPRGCAPETCNGLHCVFTRFEGEDPSFVLGLRDLSTTLGDILGRSDESPDEPEPFGPGLPVGRAVVSVGGAVLPGEEPDEHYRRSFGVAQDAVKALRLATQAHVPNLTIERVWPQYFIIDEAPPGDVSTSVVIVEHGFRGVPEPDEEAIRHADAILAAGWRRHPAEMYRDFELLAQMDAFTEGDYPGAVLKSATAAEVLIKHTAWMLEWEATEHLPADPAPPKESFEASAAKPSELIGQVLAKRLGGNWSSQSDKHPVGAWRTFIAQRRNSVIHRGYRPQEHEIEDTIGALHALEQHIVERLAAKSAVYPRTALLLAGPAGLGQRGAFDRALEALGEDQRGDGEMLADYNRWLDLRLTNAKADDI